jgi:hypothetical protein
LWLALVFVTSLVIAGFSELVTVMFIAVLLMAIVLGMLAGPARFRPLTLPPLIAALAGVSLGFVVVILSPGNPLRQAAITQVLHRPAADLRTIVTLAPKLTAQFVFEAVAPRPLKYAGAIALGVLAGFLFGHDRTLALGNRRSIMRVLIWLPLLTGAALVAGYAVPARTFTGQPPVRVVIATQYVLSLMLLLWSFALGRFLRVINLSIVPDVERRVAKAGVNMLAAALVLDALIATGRIYRAGANYSEYAAGWDKRNTALIQAANQGLQRVAVPTLTNPGMVPEAGLDPNFYVNVCLGQYYHVPTVIASKPVASPTAAELQGAASIDAQLERVAMVQAVRLAESVQSGQDLGVTVFWRPRSTTVQTLTVVLEVVSPSGETLAHYAGYPRNGEYATTTWIFDQLFADAYTLRIPAGTPPLSGAQLRLGLLDPQQQQHLQVTGGAADSTHSWVILGNINIMR